jgi:hypothetical protein
LGANRTMPGVVRNHWMWGGVRGGWGLYLTIE